MGGNKELLSGFAILLTFVGYVPYIRSVLSKKTIPHIYSWLIWTLDGLIIFALQLTHGGGSGSYVALAAQILSLSVCVLTLRNKKRWTITISDTVFALLAVMALVLWLFAKQPALSVFLITVVDFLGFLPTIRKAWVSPQSENIPFYAINTVRFLITLAAISQYSFVTSFYPGFWLVGNGLFALMLLLRRTTARVNSERP